MKRVSFLFVAAFLFVAPTTNAMTTAELLAQLDAIEDRLQTLQAAEVATGVVSEPAGDVAGVSIVQASEFPIELTSTLVVEITGVSSTTHEVQSAAAAQVICEASAYNTEYMWKQITCTLDENVMYDDVFIAG